MAAVYPINKGVARPITFKGLVGVYILYLLLGLAGLLLLFGILYVLRVEIWLILLLVLMLGAVLFTLVFRLSKRFGEHGLSKYLAGRRLPNGIRFGSRRLFVGLKGGGHG